MTIKGKVASSGEPMIFEDIMDDPRYQELSENKASRIAGYKFLAVLPIKSKQEVIGTMVCIAQLPHRLTADELQLISLMTNQIGVAIDNATLNEQTKRQALELERANKVRSEFLNVISHELRTPLTAIKGYSGLIQDKVFGATTAEQGQALAKIINYSNALLEMIKSILYATSLEADQIRPEIREVDLGRVFTDLKVKHEPPLEKNITLDWDIPPDLQPVRTDSEKVTQILQNLIDNAIKFTEKGTVTVSARSIEGSMQTAVGSEQKEQGLPTEGGSLPTADRLMPTGAEPWVEFRVSDTGIGIPREKLPVIFDMFRQVDSSETRLYGGVGLGLYIVKKFTELLGGQVGWKARLERVRRLQ